jgi:hypothetical protein
MVFIQSSGAQAASGNSANFINHTEVLTAAIYVLDVTVAGSLAGDTLNVYVQHSWDEGTSWDDFVSFTQVLGNGGAKKFLAFWVLYGTAPSTPVKAPQDAALTAGTVQQGPLGMWLRAKWAIVNGGGTHSFTFSVGVQQIEA